MFPDIITRRFVRDEQGGHRLRVGESTVPREAPMTSLGLGSGTIRFCYFTARKTETITQVRLLAGGAASGLTLCRFGVWSADANDDLTLVASTANDTAFLNTASTAYTKALEAAWRKEEGQRYAVGVLSIGTTPATPFGIAGSGIASELAVAPRVAGLITGQTDLPAAVTGSTLTAAQQRLYAALLP